MACLIECILSCFCMEDTVQPIPPKRIPPRTIQRYISRSSSHGDLQEISFTTPRKRESSLSDLRILEKRAEQVAADTLRKNGRPRARSLPLSVSSDTAASEMTVNIHARLLFSREVAVRKAAKRDEAARMHNGHSVAFN